jgi:uncharacterized protein (TIGR02466 family)
VTNQDELKQFYYFPSAVITVIKPEFLNVVKSVANEYLDATKQTNPKLNEIYPVRMTGELGGDPRLAEFQDYIGTSAWDVLSSQGYHTDNMGISIQNLWVQEHHKHSLMEQHVHGAGSQITGFYFLECPKNCCKVVFQDPRPGKVQINLPERNPGEVSFASNMVHFTPEPGMLLMANSWLPHSFSRHAAKKPLVFVHFNLGVQFRPMEMPCELPAAAEII